jgi:hypothetical protein
VTHTYVILELSSSAHDEIAYKLRAAGYDHAFNDNGEIDMHGIAVALEHPQPVSGDGSRPEVSVTASGDGGTTTTTTLATVSRKEGHK